jgi:hypothetical protein
MAHRRETLEIDRRSALTRYVVAGLAYPVGSFGANGSFAGLYAVLGERLARYEPTFYEDGWVTLRLRPGGRADRGGNGVLAPMDRAHGTRLFRIYFAWQAAVKRSGADLVRCAGLNASPAQRSACYAAAGAGFRRSHLRVDSALRDVLATLRGGCRELGGLALDGASTYVADFEQVRRAGQRGAPPELSRAASRLQRDFFDLDLPGRLGRFLVLCYPR